MAERRVLITGSTSGIGLATARRFCALGWEVFATARTSSRAEELAATLACRVVALDVDSPASIATCAAEIFERTDGYGVDVVVNNAGFARMSPILDLTDDDLREHFSTNVFGAVGVARAFLPRMIERRAGRIVNVSSTGGRMSLPLVGAYHAAKFAVEALSDAMRWELRPFGIGVSVIEPGPVRTPFADRLVESTRLLPAGSAYSPVLAQVGALQALAERHMIAPEAVARDIVHAATARRPRARYVVPRHLSVLIALARLAPACLVDRVMASMFGLSRLAPVRSR